jgi:hypothetical protein
VIVRGRNGHVGSIQPLAGGLCQPAPRQSCVGAFMEVFDEPLLNSRIEVARSPLLDGPPLMFKPCPSAPIQCSQCRYVWNWLFELTTKMAQDRGRHIFQRSQCRAGHADEAELQGGTDPVPRSECLADGTPVAIIEREPLLQREIG